MIRTTLITLAVTLVAAGFCVPVDDTRSQQSSAERSGKAIAPKLDVGKHDWPQWGGTSLRNNTPTGTNIPATWDIEKGTNIKWSAKLGSQTYGTPVVANGKVFISTNNMAAYLKRYPQRVDLGVLLCFDEQTGNFLWQYSAKKLATGRVNDWPVQGICATSLVDGDRLWVVTNRCEVVCLDIQGFRDGKNDGPYTQEPNNNRDEADVIWKFDMIGKLGVFPLHRSTCSITTDGKRIFVSTSNGVDHSLSRVRSPNAPSFLCMDRDTGKILWSDNSPGKFVLHGQWASPTYFVIDNQAQVLFPGGDGWLYSFDPRGDDKGNSKLLWKFDCNPKDSKWLTGGRGTRNNLIASPVVYKGMVYIAVGQDPHHSGSGDGHLWCLNPAKKIDGSDVSPTLAIDKKGKPLPRRRFQAIDPKKGEQAIKNPNSAVLWHYSKVGERFEDQMHRSCGTVTIKNDLLFIADISGLVHCLNALSGKRYWFYDMLASSWGSPLIVDEKVYIAVEDGDISVFPLSADPRIALKLIDGEMRPALGEIIMNNAVYSTPIVANNVLFIANRNRLYAILHFLEN